MPKDFLASPSVLLGLWIFFAFAKESNGNLNPAATCHFQGERMENESIRQTSMQYIFSDRTARANTSGPHKKSQFEAFR